MNFSSDKNTSFSKKKIFVYNGKRIDLTEPRVMGILNVTPDSFYDWRIGGLGDWRIGGLGDWGIGGLGDWKIGGFGGLMGRANDMVSDGAYIIDIGAVSTRPGAADIDAEEEKRRLFPVLKAVRKTYPELIISIDTYRAEIAEMAAGEGADMINDISGGTFDPKMIPAIMQLGIPYIIMHIQGTPATMQENPAYENVEEEVFNFLTGQAKKLEEKGHQKIILDPGFGFGKTVEQNYTLLHGLDRLVETGHPVLAGLSRKSMINRVLGTKPEEALNGTTVLNTIALMKGAKILRVHDVKPAMEAIRLLEKFHTFAIE